MKGKIKQACSVFLLLVLFISTTGFSVFSHICLMSGEKTTEFKQVEASCCATNHQEENFPADTKFKKVDCCKNEIAFIKLNFHAPKQERTQPEIPVSDLCVTNFNTGFFIPEKSSFCFDQNLPPPKPGRDVLLQTGLLRI